MTAHLLTSAQSIQRDLARRQVVPYVSGRLLSHLLVTDTRSIPRHGECTPLSVDAGLYKLTHPPQRFYGAGRIVTKASGTFPPLESVR